MKEKEDYVFNSILLVIVLLAFVLHPNDFIK